MPTFDYQCGECGSIKEVFHARSVGPSQGLSQDPSTCAVWCDDCGSSELKRLFTLSTQHSTGFKPFWHPHLGHKPVYVESWKHYRQLLAARNSSNVLAS